jgi:hypothetical protein
MPKQRKYDAAIKAKFALEALKGQRTLYEFAALFHFGCSYLTAPIRDEVEFEVRMHGYVDGACTV